jgi:diguanylate cyclase (GGDEF)-like protein
MTAPPCILFVDDDSDFCKYFQALSSSVNITLEIAGSIADAKKKIGSQPFSGFIVDGYLPDGSGVDLASWIREKRGKDVPIAFLSAGYQDAASFRLLKEKIDVDYMLNKPIKPEEAALLLRRMGGGAREAPAAEKGEEYLAELKAEFRRTIFVKLEKLEKLVQAVQAEPAQERLFELRAEVHKIAGSAGSYGYPVVSELCKKAELEIVHRVAELSTHPPDKVWLDSLGGFLREMKSAFQLGAGEERKGEAPAAVRAGERVELYIVASNRPFLDLLEAKSRELPFTVLCEADPQTALEKLSRPDFNPQMLTVEKEFPASSLTGKDLIDALRRKPNFMPTMIGMIIDKGDLEERIGYAKEKIDYILQKPLSVESLLDVLENALRAHRKYDFKVLVLDDDPDICLYISKVLAEIGIEVKVLHDGTQLFETLKQFRPDLLLLDINLPQFGGLEILQALRADIHFQNLGVMIITALGTPENIEKAYAISVEDVLAKPLDKKMLQLRVSRFLRRQEALGAFQEKDPFTGLYTWKALFAQLQELIVKSDVTPRNVALVLLEVDQFKEMAAFLGKDRVDELLVSIVNLIVRQFKKRSQIAYLQGGKFALLCEGMEARDMQFLMGGFFTDFAQEITVPAHPELTVSISCGIASFPQNGTKGQQVLEAAERALSAAQGKGGKRLEVAPYAEAAAGKKNMVLLIDDDEDLLKMMGYAFRTHGFSVKTISTGQEAMKFVADKQNLANVIIILIDRLLPDMDGIEILKRLKEGEYGKIPILIVSSLSSEKDILQGLREGAVDYVTKPFSLSVLMQKVRVLLAR